MRFEVTPIRSLDRHVLRGLVYRADVRAASTLPLCFGCEHPVPLPRRGYALCASCAEILELERRSRVRTFYLQLGAR